jgi:arylsulfatase A-like enzyme
VRAALVLGLVSLACGRQPPAVDLIAAAVTRGRSGAPSTRGELGRAVRIHDVVRRTLPAVPPSRFELEADVPRGARLRVFCGVPEDEAADAGVECVVKLRRQGADERVLASQRLEPRPPAERRWLPFDVDLAGDAGPATLILETRPLGTAPAHAYWGSPVVIVPQRRAPLVVLYLVDTLRADHTSPYGYTRDTTPELAHLAADGVTFEAAISAASWTKPAVGSILTSQPPPRHGAVQLRDALDPAVATLPEMLQAKGLATGAAIANAVIYSAGTGFEKGFDVYQGLHGAGDRPSDVVPAGPVVDAALQWLDDRAGRPAFLYVHTMDPHVPYSPPPPFDRRYAPTPDPPEHKAADPRFDYREPADRERLTAQYDGEIAYGDQELGRFLRELRGRGLYDDALIVFVADHGEELLDHGQWLHGRTVYDEVVKVPLVVKFPGGRHAGTRVKQQVETLDILPTVLSELGLPVPEAPVIAGRPLQSVLRGGAPDRAAVSQISHRGFVAFGIRATGDKYVRRLSPENDERYFDLARDPGETENRLAEAGDRAQAQRSRAEAAMFPSPYTHHLRLSGEGAYSLVLEANAFIEALDSTGFGVGERATVDEARHRLSIEARPQPGRPREVTLSVRPLGAPVWVSGTRDGRALTATDVHIAREDLAPPGVPFRLPEIEPQDASSRARRGHASRPSARGPSIDEGAANLLAAPAGDPAGVALWLTARPGVKVLDLDDATRERLRALGYLGH